MRRFLFFAALLGLADPDCTVQEVCTPGYAASRRPPATYTNRIKRMQLRKMNVDADPRDFEEDHIIPLELCGHPTDPRNLMPEPWDKARAKDRMENKLHKAVCARRMSLKEAQRKIVGYE